MEEATPEQLQLNLQIPFMDQLSAADVSETLARIVTAPLSQTAAPAGSSLSVVLVAPKDAPVPDGARLAARMSRLHVDVVGAPLRKAFAIVGRGGDASAVPMSAIRYRTSESLWVCPRADRVTVIFSLEFRDVFDAAVIRVIATEFAEANRKVSGAPPASFSEPRDVPRELRGPKGLDPAAESFKESGNAIGFLSLAFLPTHLNTPAKLDLAVERAVR